MQRQPLNYTQPFIVIPQIQLQPMPVFGQQQFMVRPNDEYQVRQQMVAMQNNKRGASKVGTDQRVNEL